MLFNSYGFIFLFLPAALGLFFGIARGRPRAAAGLLVGASLFFYGWWNPVYLVLLAGSILFNYAVGAGLGHARLRGQAMRAKWLLRLGVGGDLALLGYFKYAHFFLASLRPLVPSLAHAGTIVLPLGISFFTFTQIAFLVDVYQGKAKEYNFLHYALFVTYFPHLIAGPILHHSEMMPQFAQAKTYRVDHENLAVGLTMFAIGLFKKAVLADGIGAHAIPIFRAGAEGHPLTFFGAWAGALSYTFQLYFDFSGYSDMAIGLSRLFNITLPLNFNSPYKAANIIDFWRRWHMTLSRFLRDYLYIPLGGNRRGKIRRYVNLMVTMLLGGLWHGAGWTFVVWGGLHGVYLAINHAWRAGRQALGKDPSGTTPLGRGLAWALTFLAVVAAWVFFRMPTFQGAVDMLSGMAGLNGISIPEALAAHLGSLAPVAQQMGIKVDLGGGADFLATYAWIAALFAIAVWAPNSQELVAAYAPALGFGRAASHEVGQSGWTRRLRFQLSRRWAFATALCTACGILSLNHVTQFLYFQF